MSHTYHDQRKQDGDYQGATLPKVARPERKTALAMQLRECGEITDLILQGQAHALTNDDMRQIAEFYNSKIRGRNGNNT